MACSFRESFRGNRKRLLGDIDFSAGFLNDLLENNLLDHDEVTLIKSVALEHRASLLLQFLEDCDDALFPDFCDALWRNRQQFIAEYLHFAPDDQHPCDRTPEREMRTLLRLKESFIEMMDTDFLLLPKLMNQGVLSDSERQVVKSQPSLQQRNEVLLDKMQCKPAAAQLRFLEALRDTDQLHVCNLINSDGDWKDVEAIHGKVRPLNDAERRLIDLNRFALTQLIEPRRGIISRLFAAGCFNRFHRDHIEAGVTSFNKNERLLDIVRRRSAADLVQVIDAIEHDDKPLLAAALRSGRAIADITVYLEESSQRFEPTIIARFRAAFWRVGRWIAAGVNLLMLRRRNSIAAFFVCDDQAALQRLVELYVFGRLRFVLQELFTSLLQRDHPHVTVVVKQLVWQLSDYCRCFLYFNPIPKYMSTEHRELAVSDATGPGTCHAGDVTAVHTASIQPQCKPAVCRYIAGVCDVPVAQRHGGVDQSPMHGGQSVICCDK